LAAHQKLQYTFQDYKAEYNKQYKDEAEESMRRKLFERRLAKIHRHNSDKTKTWREGVNKFTDMTEEEQKAFRGVHGGLLAKQKSERAKRAVPNHLPEFNASAWVGVNVDWRTKGVVSAVKDQGGCGSCWTFSTAEEIESAYALKTKNLLVLSEQQILDCTPNPNDCGGTGGCGGGTVELAVARIMVMGGLTQEKDYPYVSGDGSNYQCDMSKFKPAVKVTNFVDLPSNQVGPILQYVGTTGPLSISVDASSWSGYESGVFDGCDMSAPDIDHAVQLVGFGTDASAGDYWLVRNSWGGDYGEDGYIRLRRYATPPCGVDTTPADGDGCNGGPSQVTVCGNCGILYDTVYVTM
jgi:cathepsin L